MDIGKRLQELREAKGFSQGDIEKRTGLLRCYTSRVECGHTVPSLDTLERFAAALEVKLHELFLTREGEPSATASQARTPLSPRERKLQIHLKQMSDMDRQMWLSLASKMARLKTGR